MATKKTGSPTFPTLAEIRKVLLAAQTALNRNPYKYFDIDYDDEDGNAYEDLDAAKQELYNGMLQEYIDDCLEDDALVDELTDDLPDGRDSYSDYDLENYVAEIMEESFRDEYGRDASDLDPEHFWHELVKVDPSLPKYVVGILFLACTSGGKLRTHLAATRKTPAWFKKSKYPYCARAMIFYAPLGAPHEAYEMPKVPKDQEAKAVLAQLKRPPLNLAD
jgi:hypothetical protein